jgi:subtilase family serine protease
VKIYANGVLVHSYSGQGSIGDNHASQNELRIGGRQWESEFFQGRIDDPTLYNRPLSADEVRAIYNAGSAGKGTSPPPAGLVGWWKGESNANDFLSNFRFAINYSEPGEVALVTVPVQVPDLQVSEVTVPPTALTGGNLDVSWTVTNAGETATGVSWTDRIVLSADDALDAGDVELKRVVHGGALAVNESYSTTATVTLPEEQPGSFYIFVTTDFTGTIFEGAHEDNNYSRSTSPVTVTLKSVPDLEVGTITLPAQGQPDQTIAVGWTITNAGTANALGNWTDEVYLLADGQSTGGILLARVQHSGGLAPGASYTGTANVTLPREADGNYRIRIRADADDAVFERDGEQNNDGLSAGTLALSHPNLAVTGVVAPDTRIEGYTLNVPISWSVQNSGDRGSLAGSWTDAIVYSKDEILSADDTPLAHVAHVGALPAGGTYTQSATVQIPFGETGHHFLFVVADAINQVYENGNEGDNASTATPIDMLTSYADLVVATVSAPVAAQSGDSFEVSWEVRNDGIAITNASAWTDRVLLSLDDVADGADIELANVTHGSALAKGATYASTAQVTLPNGLSGEYRILVSADAVSQVYEDGYEDNNTAAAAQVLAVTLRPSPDLIVAAVTGPPRGVSGQTVEVRWTVANTEPALAPASWIDRVYLSASDSIVGAILLGEVTHNLNLGSGQNYETARGFTLPVVADGTYHFVVVTDADGTVYEAGADGNNTAASDDPIQIGHANFKPMLTLGASTGTSGQSFGVDWSVQNIGSAAALGGWIDRVYLSNDAYFDSSDVMLGSLAHVGPLDSTSSYAGHIDVTLPAQISGQRFIIVRADADGHVIEPNGETNNDASAAVEVQLGEHADLRVASLAPQASTVAGNPARLTVTWTAENAGIVAPLITSWVDRLVFSSDTVAGNADDVTLLERDHSGGLAAGGTYSETATLTLPADLDGPYFLFLRTDIDNAVPEGADDGNNDSAATPITVERRQPDLQVTAISAPTSQIVGFPVEVPISWTVTNAGDYAASDTWSDKVFLRREGVGGGDQFLEEIVHAGPLDAGASYTESRTVKLPTTAVGAYKIFVVTDASLQVNEPGAGAEANNQSALASVDVLTAYADLVVTAITAPATAQSGSPLVLSWLVSNQGIDTTNVASWTDQVLLSTDTTASPDDIALGEFFHSGAMAKTDSYAQSQRISLPNTVQGSYFVLVATDAAGKVFEDGFEGNNSGASTTPVTITLSPSPDLRVSSITGPASGQPGESVQVEWTVSNEGAGSAQGLWTDRVYLSANGSVAGAMLLASPTQIRTIASGGSYTASTTVVLPNIPDGDYRFVVVTDAGNTVFEGASEGNNQGASADTVAIHHPNLTGAITAAPASATSGDFATVTWQVQNDGGAAANGAWSDRLYFSTDPFLDAGDIQLGSRPHLGPLAVGASYVDQMTVTLPAQISGTRYFLLKTDVDDQLNEQVDEDDNLSSAQVSIALGEHADLRVTAVTPRANNSTFVSNPAQGAIEWTVQNVGSVAPSVASWSDRIIFSGNATLGDSDDIVLATVEHSGALGINESYLQVATVTFPEDLNGPYSLFVVADVNNQVAEGAGENDNSSQATAITIDRRQPDLVVTSVVVPDGTVEGLPVEFGRI